MSKAKIKKQLFNLASKFIMILGIFLAIWLCLSLKNWFLDGKIKKEGGLLGLIENVFTGKTKESKVIDAQNKIRAENSKRQQDIELKEAYYDYRLKLRWGPNYDKVNETKSSPKNNQSNSDYSSGQQNSRRSLSADQMIPMSSFQTMQPPAPSSQENSDAWSKNQNSYRGGGMDPSKMIPLSSFNTMP